MTYIQPSTIYMLWFIVGLLCIGGIYYWQMEEEERFKQRFRLRNEDLQEASQTQNNSFIDKFYGRLAERAYDAGIQTSIKGLRQHSISRGCIIVTLVTLATGNFLVSFPFFFVGVLVTILKVKRAEGKLEARIEVQLEQAAVKMQSILRSSPSILRALEEAGTVPDPIGRKFRAAAFMVKKGQDLQSVLRFLKNNINTQDGDLLFNGLLVADRISSEVALKAITSTISIIRKRDGDRSAIRTITATGRASIKIVGFSPMGIFLFCLVFKYELVSQMLTDALGLSMLFVAAILNIVGFIWAKQILSIKKMIRSGL